MIGLHYFAVHESKLMEWEQIYWPLNVRGELDKMKLWLDANPRRRKKQYHRFVVNWLNKEHAKLQRQQIESKAYAKVGVLDEARAAAKHEENLRLIAELSGGGG